MENQETSTNTPDARPRCLSRLVRCPRCGREDVMWHPAPDQRENEDSTGPREIVPDWCDKRNTRLSPADSEGKRYLLHIRRRGQSPSYWPAELSCPRCVPEGRAAAAAWNAFMGRDSSPNAEICREPKNGEK